MSVCQRDLQILHICLYGGGVADGDGAIARRALASRPSRVAEHAPGNVGEIHEILVHERVACTPESLQAVLDIRRIARLGKLAVVDDVDSAGDLLRHHFRDRGANPSGQSRSFDRQSFFFRKHHLHEIGRARKAARVRGEKSIEAALHGSQRIVGSPHTVHGGSCA